MSINILIVLTSHASLGDTDKPTGFHLSELTHPVAVFEAAGFHIDYISPQGGKAPMTGIDKEDPINAAFLSDTDKMQQIENTLTPNQIQASKYKAIYYTGGHGTLWDFPNNKELSAIASAIYENGGVIGAVCHGSSGLMGIQLSSGNALVKDKTISCFTNDEEDAIELTKIVPFLLETELVSMGAKHEKSPNFEKKVVVSERLVTGQNPASAAGVAEAMVELIK